MKEAQVLQKDVMSELGIEAATHLGMSAVLGWKDASSIRSLGEDVEKLSREAANIRRVSQANDKVPVASNKLARMSTAAYFTRKWLRFKRLKRPRKGLRGIGTAPGYTCCARRRGMNSARPSNC